ncbi:ras-like GTP-binding protein RhoL isoform X2 [Folsomia candida]|uniref:ras-like GTP-binding protein RhoL isoform X2 n=1 Tax=Folsomia candida TaxID=158441 RepID=UPI000B9001C2|nr:ras-like GTP-binding protein RhoL isoform X2 [Folsomia candida]
MDKRAPLKVVVVGDGMVGKSCMCKSFANKEPYRNKAYQPTIRIEEWEKLRSQDYENTDCFLCCYSIENRTSFTNVESKWIPELRRYCPTTPVIVLGMKKDLRSPSNSLISEDEGRALVGRVRAQGFIECTSRSLSSLEAVFIMTVSTVLDIKSRKSSNRKSFSCKIL